VLVTSISEFCGWVMWGPDWRPAVDWIQAELLNIRAASTWLASQPDAANQLRLRLLESLWPFWQSRGHAREGSALLEAALANPGGNQGIRSASLNVLGVLKWICNDLDGSMAALDAAFPMLQELDFAAGLGRNFLVRSLIAWSRNDLARAERMGLIARKHFDGAGDDVAMAMSGLTLGIVARQRHDYVLATDWFEKVYRDCLDVIDGGFLWGMGMAQYFLAEIARTGNDRVRAVTHFRAALQLLMETGDPWTVGGCAGALAGYLVADGELDDAARLLGATEALESSHGILLPPTERVAHETAARELHELIGPDRFVARFAEGQNWSMETAVAGAMFVPMESSTAQTARQSRLHSEPVTVELPEPYLRTLRLGAAGLNAKEIAQQEGIAQSSVYLRFNRIKELLDMEPHTSHAELLVHAVRLGIV
jgi:DNA-binding CsgD family transcriptional regulator